MRASRKVSTFSLVVVFALLFILSSSSIFTFAYSSNNNSNPITVLAKNQSTYQINLSGGYVYWNNNGTQIRRVSESGGTVEDVLNSSGITGFALSGNFIYWSTQIVLNSYLYKTDLLNHKTIVLCTSNSSEYCTLPFSIQVSGNYVFFASPFGLFRMDTNGSDLKMLTPRSLLACATNLTLSAGFVYWSNCSGQAGKVSFSGKKAQYLGPDFCTSECASAFISGVHSITVANSYVYWTYNVGYSNDTNFQLVNSVSTSGNHFKTLFEREGSSGFLTSVAYYNGNVIFPYLTGSTSGKIYSVPATGGKPTVLANRAATDSEVSGGYLYFCTSSQIDKLAL